MKIKVLLVSMGLMMLVFLTLLPIACTCGPTPPTTTLPTTETTTPPTTTPPTTETTMPPTTETTTPPTTETTTPPTTTPTTTPPTTTPPTTTPPTTTPTTTPPTTTPPPPPSQEELAKKGFAYPEVPRITCEQLKQMKDRGDDFILVDARPEWGFKSGYLPGAINIPNALVPTTLPEDQEDWTMAVIKLLSLPKDKLIVFYCDWPDDDEAASLAKKLIGFNAGYENIKVLWKGYFRWLELGYPTK